MNEPRQSIHFVISAPRSGSTWLARALGNHPQLFATENRLFGHFCEIWPNKNGTNSPRITFDQYARGLGGHTFVQGLGFPDARQFQAEFLPAYFQFLIEFLQQRSGKSIVVDKITPYLGTAHDVVQQIKKWFPHAHIIHLIRDGRDVVTSGVFDWISREDSAAPRHKWMVDKNPDVVLQRFFDDASLETWCRYWTEPIAALTPPAHVSAQIRYEEMIADQATELMRVFECLGVDAEPELTARCVKQAEFRQATGRPRGQEEPLAKTRKGIVGDWRNYFTRADAERFAQLTGDTLIELGYETDHGWISNCPAQLQLCSR